jgi:hypothetical protein
MTGPRWRKSSHSQTNGACVEIAGTLDAVRDSKNPTGPALGVDVAALVRAVRAGRFDR